MSTDKEPQPDPQATEPTDAEVLDILQSAFEAARNGDAEFLKTWLERGLPPNLQNTRGDTLLMLAAYHSHTEAVRTLLDHGADPDILNDQGQTPLMGAAFRGDHGHCKAARRAGRRAGRGRARRQDGTDDGRNV